MLAATNNPAPQFYSAPSPSAATAMMMEQQHQQQIAAQRRPLRKRKPEAPPENNERLSKRLSLLNLGRFFYLFQFFPYPAAHSIPPLQSNLSQSRKTRIYRITWKLQLPLPTTTHLPSYLPSLTYLHTSTYIPT